MFTSGLVKIQYFDPIAKHIKPSTFGFKSFIADSRPHCAKYNILCNSKHKGNSLQVKRLLHLSTRTYPYPPWTNTWRPKSLATASGCKNFDITLRATHSGRNDETPEQKSVILYIQNPFRWLVNKLDFGMLRRAWDPTFKENEFRDGTKLAVSSVTQLISSNNFDDLEGLLTPAAISLLRHEVETIWTDVQRRNVNLTKEEIKVALPQRVRFQRLNEKKFCDVDMLFLALKQSRYEGRLATVFMEIKVRFHRDYTDGLPPEWTVAMFRVARFSVLPR
ncbi:uncharacterized protein LOC124161296 [Ischnura elegans]|uniref:uncharacterized protein LOC124161296 n=1 Tax=Ischnura elegans TaxID=197161 RepID=UPI001ED88318|nr:uncharacterized protein LOC124161296 [Ischnura elegans]